MKGLKNIPSKIVNMEIFIDMKYLRVRKSSDKFRNKKSVYNCSTSISLL